MVSLRRGSIAYAIFVLEAMVDTLLVVVYLLRE